MVESRSEKLPIATDADVVKVRQVVRQWAGELAFTLVEQTKVVTAASELARNALVHGGGGRVVLEMLSDPSKGRGLRLTFEDDGPGIPDIALAMKEGYTTGTGLGLGLSGAKKLSNEFEIASTVDRGTRVSIVRWK